jgi:hypothetical protein
MRNCTSCFLGEEKRKSLQAMDDLLALVLMPFTILHTLRYAGLLCDGTKLIRRLEIINKWLCSRFLLVVTHRSWIHTFRAYKVANVGTVSVLGDNEPL